MNIQEQIIALLNGEITDESQVSELMHVLAVSPEKRGMLVEQIRLSHAFRTMGAGMAPSHAADAGLWQGIASIDAELAGRPPVVPPVAGPITAPGAQWFMRSSMLTLMATLLVGAGIGVGYLMSEGTSDGPASGEALATSSVPTPITASTALDDSLAALHARLNAMRTEYGLAIVEIDRLRALPAPAPVIRYVQVPVPTAPAATETGSEFESPALIVETRPRPVSTSEADATTTASTIDRADLPAGLHAPAFDPSSLEIEGDALQGGLRNNFRHSLTRVYDDTRPNALTDREIYLTAAMGGDGSGSSGLNVGIAGGHTIFSFITEIPSSTGHIDTVYQLSRPLWYGRAYIAPKLFAWEQTDITASLEIGGGGTQVGPFGTLGLDFEYLPTNRISIHLGVSAWQLWSKLRNNVEHSVNLNAHWGAGIRF